MSHFSPAYSITIRLKYKDVPGALGRMTSAIGDAGGSIGAVDIVDSREGVITRDFSVQATDVAHGDRIAKAVNSLNDVDVINVSDRTFLMHLGGKMRMTSSVRSSLIRPPRRAPSISYIEKPSIGSRLPIRRSGFSQDRFLWRLYSPWGSGESLKSDLLLLPR